MDIKAFLKNREEMQRSLPIFILADTSGSMVGAKIDQLKRSLREMIQNLQQCRSVPGQFKLAVITFDSEVRVIQPLEDVAKLTLDEKELHAQGRTSMGKAFETVAAMIEDKQVVDSRSYAPTVVLMSDGAPTDFDGKTKEDIKNWPALKKLKEGPRSQKAQRLALAIGSDADVPVLKGFIGREDIPLIRVHNEARILNFLNWVTMSVVSRLRSADPNQINVLPSYMDYENPDDML